MGSTSLTAMRLTLRCWKRVNNNLKKRPYRKRYSLFFVLASNFLCDAIEVKRRGSDKQPMSDIENIP